ncbi:peptide chain release factor 2 [Ignatzschineria indica]|uniref:Peptide chain release factor 2 n=1 Tax=Ignatzschineria indica TaxID=472583 RepID=A0A2U2AIM0_9GAMM|nr:peptide chain release factor 2 [Ignatzschineria indica]MDM1545676.1 peptide chain release factor 2 [Ignatzschineria indica]PWD82429.1 peptide chain release factor 2 [Ignatzschineria indica]
MELINTLNHTIKDLSERAADLRRYLDFDLKQERLTEVLMELEDPNIWSENPEKAQKLGQERATLDDFVNGMLALQNGLDDAKDLVALAKEENDEETLLMIEADLLEYQKKIEQFEFKRMFSGEMDGNNAFIDIQAGAGGTEAQDWASMVLRMYLRWGEHHGFKTELLEASPGDVAGIKSASIRFEGDHAFGWLRTETGVHRLVRKSPFDSNNKRHTSFCSVFVSPEIDDNIEIDIDPSDLRVDVYRASGAGGQHVNVTESAVRITHIPTGVVAQCQNERSQHRNKDVAMQQLRSKLYELEMQKKRDAAEALQDSKADVGWGSQIRSYVLDQARIRDLRTGYEVGNPQPVLDGDLDDFIEASLKMGL